MRELDAWAIGEQGVEGMLLMEEAGHQLAVAVEEVAPAGRVVALCGGGNNGGDGYVAARLLREAGRTVDVVAVAPPDSLSGDAATAHARLPGAPPVPFTGELLRGAAVVIDALLGTGAAGAPRGAIAAVIEALNQSGSLVVAADCPSGVDASTGEVPGIAVLAHTTVTFAAQKVGLWVAPGKWHAGEVRVAPLPYPGRWPVADRGVLLGGYLVGVPPRGAASTKFTSGHVVVVGGSAGLSGAPVLAALGALRGGAGYVTVGVPSGSVAAVDHHLVEAMPLMLPGPADHHGHANVEPIVEHLAAPGGALVLGPGLGVRSDAQELVRDLLAVPVPLVLDADGLNAIAGRLSLLASRVAPTVLTPHAGELARLLDVDVADVHARRLQHAQAAAEAAQAVVVLKGDDTIVAHPDTPNVGVSRGGAPGLATAGTGDILAGVLGSLLARRLSAAEAASVGVELHTEAGRIAAARLGTADCVIASDVAQALPAALTALRGHSASR